jgi:hypothetical protein
MSEVQVQSDRRRSERTMQVLFAVISLLMLGFGIAINWFAAEAGLSRDVVDAAAFGMLLGGVAHAMALWLWAR